MLLWSPIIAHRTHAFLLGALRLGLWLWAGLGGGAPVDCQTAVIKYLPGPYTEMKAQNLRFQIYCPKQRPIQKPTIMYYVRSVQEMRGAFACSQSSCAAC